LITTISHKVYYYFYTACKLLSSR